MAYQEFAYYYDRLMDEMPYPQWIRFAQIIWDQYGVPQQVVDLGCGTGSIAIPLAQTGLQVTGIDISSDMLAIAREKLDFLRRTSSLISGGSVTWLEQDIREWTLSHPVDSVISFCDCINYLLEEEDVHCTFQRVFKGLKNDGVFMFDVHTAKQLHMYNAEQPYVLNEESIAYIWTCDLDKKRCEIEHHLTIFANETAGRALANSGRESFRKIEEIHTQRAYPLDWLSRILQETGFRKIECFADFQMHPPTEQSRRVFFVAQK